MTHQDIKLTTMQEFALNILKAERGEEVYPGYIADQWALISKRGVGASSRKRFGFTSAAYRTLRSLVKVGLANAHHHKTRGGYSYVTFTSK